MWLIISWRVRRWIEVQFIGKVAERLGLDEAAITREKFIAFAQCDMIGLGADSKRQRASEIKYIEFTYSPAESRECRGGDG